MLLSRIIERRRKDRRCHRRISENLLVFCSDGNSQCLVEGFTEDISGKGMRIIAEKLFSPKEIVHIELYQPVALDCNVIMAIHIQGETVWTEEIKVAERGKVRKGYRMGVCFHEHNQKEDIEIIEKYIGLFLASPENEKKDNLDNHS